jgi:transposase
MRFVQIKSVEQQGRLMLHRARDLLMRQRTQLINALRAHIAELGIAAAQGREGVKELLKIIASEQDARMPVDAHTSLVVLAAGLHALQTMIRSIERRIIAQHRSDEASKRLRSIPGIGIVGATAIAATVADPKVFRSGRDFAAWIGIVPRQDSTGGKQKLGPISKQGDHPIPA